MVRVRRDSEGRPEAYETDVVAVVHPVARRAMKADELARRERDDAIRSNVAPLDDEFSALYETAASKHQIIQPPYDLKTLELKVQENNALGPCVDAMEANIPGTGFDVTTVAEEGEEEDEPRKEALEGFFREVWPGTSFTTLRRNVRRDMEATGMSYVEVLRDLSGEIVLLRHARAKNVRMVRLDEPVPVTVSVRRGGRDVDLKVMMRERRFAQLLHRGTAKVTYFREFGTSRQLDKDTGRWEEPDKPIPPEKRATELIQFGVMPDVGTPYYVPRWIGQTPSVVGSRMAEEYNVEFFKSGGVPPFIAFLIGGRMAERAQENLNAMLSGSAKTKQRGIAFEIYSTSGSLEREGAAKVHVERFGAEGQNDSLFEGYDERSEKRIRRAFRLPPLFVGLSQDFNYATAYASYTVAEAQVFAPERQEEDEQWNNTIMKELDPTGTYRIRSRPLAVKDAAMQMEAALAAFEGKAIDRAEFLRILNEVVNSDMKLKEGADEEPEEDEGAVPPQLQVGGNVVPMNPGSQPQPGQPPPTGAPGSVPAEAEKSDAVELASLASRINRALDRALVDPRGARHMKRLCGELDALHPEDRRSVCAMVAANQYEAFDLSPDELAGAAGDFIDLMARSMAAE